MTRLMIDLPEEMNGRLQARAAAAGFATSEEYVRELIAADAADFDAKVESLLLRRIDAADVGEMTPSDFEKIRDQVRLEAGRDAQ